MGTAQNVGAAGSILSGVSDIVNLGFSISNANYQKRLQKKIFQREDTAVQRRVADLKAAGLNPVLAAGSAAGSGGTVAVNTPQLSDPTDKLSMAYDLATMDKNLERTDADIMRTKADMLKTQKEIEVMGDTQKYIKTQTQGQFLKNQRDKIDLELMQKTGMSSSGGWVSGLVKDLSGMIYNASGNLDSVKDAKGKTKNKTVPKKDKGGMIDYFKGFQGGS